MSYKIYLSVLFLLAALQAPAYGQEKPTRFFSEQGELGMELNADWKALFAGSDGVTRYPGKLTLNTSDGTPLVLDVQIRTRGISRRKRRLCRFPPLKIYFDKEQVAGTSLRGIKSLKLVTHCSTSRRFHSYYIKEFLAYRAYNEITPMSFAVRSIRATYTDSRGKRAPDTRFAFFIEDVDDMAKRNKLVEIESGKFRPSMLDAKANSLYSVFQYMIGNLDWSSMSGPDPDGCCHNSKLISAPDGAPPYYPVPYDFDVSGLVNAHYALPPQKLRVRKITDRLYRGFCSHNHLTEASLDIFRTKKQAILALFSDDPRLDYKNKRKALEYLNKFFKLIDKPGASEKVFNRSCRGKS